MCSRMRRWLTAGNLHISAVRRPAVAGSFCYDPCSRRVLTLGELGLLHPGLPRLLSNLRPHTAQRTCGPQGIIISNIISGGRAQGRARAGSRDHYT